MSQEENKNLVKLLKAQGVLRSFKIENAMLVYPREYFVPKEYSNEAYGNYPLPIGEGQTISQPLTVIFMLELLDVQPGNKILEIGYGSGWQTALLSYLVGKNGQIVAFEIHPKVAEFGKNNLASMIRIMNTKTSNAALFPESYTPRFKQYAPYDRIISGAAFETIPNDLRQNLKDKGILVVPTASNDIRVIKREGEKFEENIIPGFVFVPIIN